MFKCNAICFERKMRAWRQYFTTWMRRKYAVISHRRLLASFVNDKHLKQDNIILMGSPGSGKTTVGKILSRSLGLEWHDIDDHHLEKVWGMTVAQKLSSVDDDGFIQQEGDATLSFKAKNSVISLTGSNPMHQSAMNHIRSLGTVVYIDVQPSDIINRLEKMKTNRIVGLKSGEDMHSFLKFRRTFYDTSYDMRLMCLENESPESVSNRILEMLQRYRKGQSYISTRSDKPNGDGKSFNEVVLRGLAEDGGLFVSENPIPHSSIGEWKRLIDASFQERAVAILEKWIHPADMSVGLLSNFVNDAYSAKNFDHVDVFPLVHLERNQYALELFHGPSGSFKDAALQLMPHIFVNAKKEREPNTRYVILVATSGDTGSAVLDGYSKYSGKDGVGVMVLFPEDGVSSVQKQQMTTAAGKNVHVVGVDADFDFCQSTIKNIFNDDEFGTNFLSKNSCKLSAANSINWGRLIPQVVYHASSYLDLVRKGVIRCGDEVDLCIPTGNFGNILGAFYSKQMGIPFKRLICASNSNNVLTEFFRNGIYDLRTRSLQKTASPAIDILKSSNLERYIYYKSGCDGPYIKKLYDDLAKNGYFQVSNEILEGMLGEVLADWCSEEECMHTIKDVFARTGYLMDPHTSLAKTVANKFDRGDRPIIISATAHPGKFADIVLKALDGNIDGIESSPVRLLDTMEGLDCRPEMHKPLKTVAHRPRIHKQIIQANVENVISEVKNFIRRI